MIEKRTFFHPDLKQGLQQEATGNPTGIISIDDNGLPVHAPLVSFLKNRDISIERFAQMTGVSVPTIRNTLSLIQIPDHDTAINLAKTTGQKPADLFPGWLSLMTADTKIDPDTPEEIPQFLSTNQPHANPIDTIDTRIALEETIESLIQDGSLNNRDIEIINLALQGYYFSEIGEIIGGISGKRISDIIEVRGKKIGSALKKAQEEADSDYLNTEEGFKRRYQIKAKKALDRFERKGFGKGFYDLKDHLRHYIFISEIGSSYFMSFVLGQPISSYADPDEMFRKFIEECPGYNYMTDESWKDTIDRNKRTISKVFWAFEMIRDRIPEVPDNINLNWRDLL